jgi:hypothetical protein
VKEDETIGKGGRSWEMRYERVLSGEHEGKFSLE